MVNEVGFQESTQFENVSQGVYRWNDGTIADYFNWRQLPVCNPTAFQQPNDNQNSGVQDCVVIRSKVSPNNANGCTDNYWDDVGCFRDNNADNGYDFVCERRPTCWRFAMFVENLYSSQFVPGNNGRQYSDILLTQVCNAFKLGALAIACTARSSLFSRRKYERRRLSSSWLAGARWALIGRCGKSVIRWWFLRKCAPSALAPHVNLHGAVNILQDPPYLVSPEWLGEDDSTPRLRPPSPFHLLRAHLLLRPPVVLVGQGKHFLQRQIMWVEGNPSCAFWETPHIHLHSPSTDVRETWALEVVKVWDRSLEGGGKLGRSHVPWNPIALCGELKGLQQIWKSFFKFKYIIFGDIFLHRISCVLFCIACRRSEKLSWWKG